MTEPTIDPVRVFRRSEAETFGCPYRYQQIYLRDVDDSGDESVRGRAFHAVFWIYVLRLVNAQTDADHEEASLALQEGIAISKLPDQLVSHVSKLWWRFVKSWKLDLEAFLAAEELQRHGGRVFRPDLVYARPNELEIQDVKTFFKGLTEEQASQELQLRWYLVEALKAWPGFARYRFTYVFVRLNYSVSLVFTPEQIAEWEPEVQGSIDAILQAEAKGEFPAIPGSHCTLCRLACPVVDNPARMIARVTSLDEAMAVAGDILALEQRVKQLKNVLRAWALVEGGLVVNGQAFEHREVLKVSYPAAIVLDYLRRKDIPVDDIWLSKSALGKLTDPKKTPEEVTAFLAGYADVEQTWQFKHRKGGLIADDDKDDEDADD
jgi:hypothetical protein